MITDPILLLLIICLDIVVAEYLARLPFLKQLGTSMLVIVLGALEANFGLIPTASHPVVLYEGVMKYVAPMSIFFLLLGVDLKSLRKAGLPMVFNFFLGAAGIMLGVGIGMWAIGGKENLGPFYYAIGGMFTGTFTGGSINLNAVALHYGVAREGALYTAVTAIDNIMTAIWISVTILIPTLMKKYFPTRRQASGTHESPTSAAATTDKLTPLSMAQLIGMAAFTMWLSGQLEQLIPGFPKVLWLTTIALALAQIPQIQQIRGGKQLGMFAIFVFLTVIGAHCDIPALLSNGQFALTMILFVLVLVSVHSLVAFGLGYWLKQDWDIMGIASQANLGGSSTAMACAESLERNDLALGGILLGALGNAVGTYLGILMAELLKTI
ncbi:MAG: DUF819 family protein [Spirosomataceae bacterium]